MKKTPEELADIALGQLLDHGFPMEQAADWANWTKLMNEALEDVVRLRESCQKNLRAAQHLTLLAGGMVLCSLIVPIVYLLA